MKRDKRSALETSGGSDIRFFVGGVETQNLASLNMRGKKTDTAYDAVTPKVVMAPSLNCLYIWSAINKTINPKLGY